MIGGFIMLTIITLLYLLQYTMQKITPFLWFDNNAEEAINFYTSVFKNGKIKDVSRYGKGAPLAEGTVMTGTFEIEGQEFYVLNGGPLFQFSPAISFFVHCENQEEIDMLWEKLSSEGGNEGRCGWVTDRYGVSWQIVPTILSSLLHDEDTEKSARVMQAMLRMNKMDIETLKKSYEG